MLKRNLLSTLFLPLLAALVAAQDSSVPPGKQAAAGAEQGEQDKADGEDAEVKVLQPRDVPAEAMRIEKRKTKADIKCELTMTPTHGREVTVKGVIRNGKLIERFAGRDFVQDPTIEHPQCGVRVWWVDNTSGWIFLRYSQIHTIALTGVLTAEEKKRIMEALRAREKQKEDESKAKQVEKLDEDLAKMTSAELEAYLLREYPQEQGWTSEKLRELKKKQLIDNLPLTRQESVFVSHFSTLIKARLKELKREKDKTEFEPGSADKPQESSAGTRRAPPVQPREVKPPVKPPEDEYVPEDDQSEDE